MKIGVLSDTHGLLRPEAIFALKGCDAIIHAGDVGNAQIISQLKTIAPVYAVRGNIDKAPWARSLPQREIIEVGDKLIYVLHNLDDLDLEPVSAGIGAVIYGHTHRPEHKLKDGVLYLNPGSIGPPRGDLPISMALLRIGQVWSVEQVTF